MLPCVSKCQSYSALHHQLPPPNFQSPILGGQMKYFEHLITFCCCIKRTNETAITVNNFDMIGEPVTIGDTSLGGEDKSLRDDAPRAVLILEFLLLCIIVQMLFFVLGCDENKPRDMFLKWQTIEYSVGRPLRFVDYATLKNRYCICILIF